MTVEQKKNAYLHFFAQQKMNNAYLKIQVLYGTVNSQFFFLTIFFSAPHHHHTSTRQHINTPTNTATHHYTINTSPHQQQRTSTHQLSGPSTKKVPIYKRKKKCLFPHDVQIGIFFSVEKRQKHVDVVGFAIGIFFILSFKLHP